MKIDNGDGTIIGGSLDVLCILHDVQKNRFHAAFFEEHPLPGPIMPMEETKVVRLKSNLHHTGGSDTLEGAREHLQELRSKIQLPDENLTGEPIPWEGELGIVWIVPNWRHKDALATFQ